jgi:uncharacterized protein YpmS
MVVTVLNKFWQGSSGLGFLPYYVSVHSRQIVVVVEITDNPPHDQLRATKIDLVQRRW